MAEQHPQRHAIRPATTKSKVAVVVLIALVLLFISLGNWQLRRADERREVSAQIEAGRSSAPITLKAQANVNHLAPWQSVHVRGVWAPEWSLLLDNRNLDGKPGLWLATVLKLDQQTGILVLRGWVPRPIGEHHALPSVRQSTQAIELSGEVLNRVPQLYQIAKEEPLAAPQMILSVNTDSQTSLDLSALPRRQNVGFAELEAWTGTNIMPIVLLQTSATPNPELLRDWPEPSVDADKNVGYALQWFSFAAIAIGAIGVLLWRLRTRAKIPPTQTSD